MLYIDESILQCDMPFNAIYHCIRTQIPLKCTTPKAVDFCNKRKGFWIRAGNKQMALLESEEETAMFLESKEGFEVQMQG